MFTQKKNELTQQPKILVNSKVEVCISYQKYAPSDISGCNHATGSIMKYTLPFLLALDKPVCLFTS